MTLEEFSWYNEQYERQIEQLEHKIEYIKNQSLNVFSEDSFLLDVFIDSVLVDIRALMLESKRYKKNYTVQNSIKIGSKDEDKSNILYKISQSIDDFFVKTRIDIFDMNLFDSIKFYTDKFIAHKDSISKENFEKMKKLKQYFIMGEYSIINIVKGVLDYTRKCKYSVIVTSLNYLTEGEDTINFDEQEERDYLLEKEMFELLVKYSFDQIDSILYLRAKGIKDKNKEVIRKIFEEKISLMNTIERSNLLIKIKKLENKKCEYHENFLNDPIENQIL